MTFVERTHGLPRDESMMFTTALSEPLHSSNLERRSLDELAILFCPRPFWYFSSRKCNFGSVCETWNRLKKSHTHHLRHSITFSTPFLNQLEREAGGVARHTSREHPGYPNNCRMCQADTGFYMCHLLRLLRSTPKSVLLLIL